MKEYMFIPTEMKATNRFDYECEANDVRVRYCFKDGKIDEVHIKVDGDVGWTVIGWGDLTVAIWQVADYGLRTYQVTLPFERTINFE